MLVFLPSGIGAASIPKGPFALRDNDIDFLFKTNSYPIVGKFVRLTKLAQLVQMAQLA